MGALQTRLGLAAGAVLALGVGALTRQVVARPPAQGRARPLALRPGAEAEAVLHVPHMPGGITLDGDTDDPGWTRPPGPARTGAFVLESGAAARPFSEARVVWGDGHLYLSLYAADEDVRTRTEQSDGPLWLDDSFRLVFTQAGTQYVVEVSPRGVVTDAVRRSGGALDYSWTSGAHVSPELDGTLNRSDDMDEEWVIEMALPFAALGMTGEAGESIGFAVRRCDTPKDGVRGCAGWGEAGSGGRIELE